MFKYLALVVVLFMPTSSFAAENESDKLAHEKPDQGWFWYEHPKDEEKEKKEEKPKVKETQKDGEPDKSEKRPISAAWLRENLPKLHERAIDNPTRENIQAYMYAQRAMMDKAQRYAEATKMVVESDPLLDENNRIPISQFGKEELLDKEYLGKKKALKYLASNVGGLFVFFDSKCDFCRLQARTVNAFAKDYGFAIKYISMDGKGLPEIKHFVKDNGHAQMLDLKVFPTTVFVSPPSTYLIVSQGVMAQDDLGSRILTAAQDKKLIPSDMVGDINPWDRGVLSPEDLEDGATDNMDEFVKNLQQKLKKHY